MSVLAYPPTNDEEIFRRCTNHCGIVTSTEDQQYFALECTSCAEKFLYFDAFIEHIQTKHGSGCNDEGSRARKRRHDEDETNEDLTDTQPPILEAPVVMIKEEKYDMDDSNVADGAHIRNEPLMNNDSDYADGFYRGVKKEEHDPDLSIGAAGDSSSYMADTSYLGDSFASYNEDYEEDDEAGDDANYDDMVEESLLDSSAGPGVTNHIKDRRMIQFLIEAYRRNTFLWDHHHPQFRDRVKRSQFLEWINAEFQRRFNLVLAKDAVTRKWDNLRTVYKRECNRMALERTNVSTLWYFKELFFLNRMYGGNQKLSDAVIKETVYRKRFSALWNDISTNKLIELLKNYPCFYDKYHSDYRSKEKRGEALQKMARDLGALIDVSPIQISKRISQLRFDYSKQKQERIMCEMAGRSFTPNYTYYELMSFMDSDIAPFKCEHCPMILNSPRELDTHLLSHQHKSQSPSLGGSASSSGYNGVSNYYCPVCQLCFTDLEQLNRHKQKHPQLKEVKYHCDLCTASFREKGNYDEHMRRHNDELLLPDLNLITPADSNDEIITGDNSPYHSASEDSSKSSVKHRCPYPTCTREFTTRSKMNEHAKLHYSDEEYPCDICGKTFRSVKNLQNHKQIHDAVKKYVCKICGSAFAQAAGLYLHKRRHNRPM
ncbi:zinc finger protein 585A-like [Musca vetustissima]|uniref:zinc finger protein 585A-like n=1 Tax=Musca vetustissima TaxID=27455 RepID=UPI002AB62D1E|nr:zinc finger protein 585A-like [Musca vetustissima]